MRDVSASGVAERSESDVPLACAATPSRSRRNDTDESYGCRDSAKEMTPQRRTRLEVLDQPSRALSTARFVTEWLWPISKLARDRSADAATVGFKDAATSSARSCRNSREKTNDKMQQTRDEEEIRPLRARERDRCEDVSIQPEAPAQPDEREPQAGTVEHDNRFEMCPEIPPTWELELDARGHSETLPNFSSCSVLGSVARQLLGWSPCGRYPGITLSQSRHLPCRVACA